MCKCNENHALYNDTNVIRCQYCMQPVSKKRAHDYLKYNGLSDIKIQKQLAHGKQEGHI